MGTLHDTPQVTLHRGRVCLRLQAVLVASILVGACTERAPMSADEPPDGREPMAAPTTASPVPELSRAPVKKRLLKVPTYSSEAVRDEAFAGSVAGLTSYEPFGDYGAAAPFDRERSIRVFKKVVVEDAKQLCAAMDRGSTGKAVLQDPGTGLNDPIDHAAFLLEATSFYCTQHLDEAGAYGAVDGFASTPQEEDCPSKPPVAIEARIVDGLGSTTVDYEVSVKNTSEYEVWVNLEQRSLAPGFPSKWTSVNDLSKYSPSARFNLNPYEMQSATGFQSGAFEWSKVEFRVQAGEYIALGCANEPGSVLE